MATHYHIQELTNGLRIHASDDFEQWERLLAAGFAAAIVGVVGSVVLGGGWSLALSPIAAMVVFVAVRARRAELQVTRVEFVTKGDLGRRVQTPRIVCTADVIRLEFQGGSGWLATKLGGLYALTARREFCVLPFLDWQQAVEVIRAIENKFPGLAEHWRAQSPNADPSLKLGLTKDK